MQPFLLNTDSDPKNQLDKTARLNINVNLNYEYGSISSEDGNAPLHLYPTTETPRATIIGKIPLLDGNIVLFSVIEGDSFYNNAYERHVTGEIGVLSPNGSYRILLRDNGPFVGGDFAEFGWNLNTQIQGIYKINLDGSTSIYWVDFVNQLRMFNITNSDIQTDDFFRVLNKKEFNKLNVVLNNAYPTSLSLSSVDNNGNLTTGVYYVALVYTDKDYNESNILAPIGPISIVNEISPIPIENYDGAVADTTSTKSFTIAVTGADTSFSYFKIYVIAKINSVLSVYDFGYQTISANVNIQINTLINKSLSTLDVLIDKLMWVAKTITQLNNKAYIGNLKLKPRPNLQTYINNIIVDTATDYNTPIDVEAFNTSFHSEKVASTKRVFQHDEVYALYASVVFNDGYESELYHIPGRPEYNVNVLLSGGGTQSVAEANLISSISPFNTYTYNGGGVADTSPGGEIYNIDNTARAFHAFDTANNANVVDIYGVVGLTTNLGFWQNKDEIYPNTPDWNVTLANGTVRTLSSIQKLIGNKVRHHKMPSVAKLQTPGLSVYAYKPLALRFKNIIFPQELSTEIVRIKFHYAKRTNANRLVFGQSILINDCNLLGSSTFGGTYGPITDGIGQVSTDYSFGMGTSMEMFTMETNGAGDASYKQMDMIMNRFKMSPFDAMIGDIDPSSTSYVKVFAFLRGDFVDEFPPTDVSSDVANLNYNSRLSFTPATYARNTIYSSFVRRLKGPATLAESIPSYPNGNVGNAANAGQLNYTLDTVHYRNEKHIILETVNDFSKLDLYASEYVFYIDNMGYGVDKRILLGNLYFFKQDLYKSFDDQDTVSTVGVFPLTNAFSGGADTADNVYGGDTFVSIHGHRGTTDLLPAINFKSPGNIAGEWKVVHPYLCESNANINYRHQGTGQYDIYYPKSTMNDVLNVPLLPNGFGNYYGYNNDYTSVNDLISKPIHLKNYIQRTDSFSTRIAASALENPESVMDNYRIYLPNEYTDVEKSKGDIINIVNYNNRLIIQHENSIKATTTTDRIKTDEGEAFLGAGDIFEYPAKDLLLTDNGYGGLKHQFSSVLTQYGVYYLDYNTSKVFCLSDKLKPISDKGMIISFLTQTPLVFENLFRNLTFSETSIWAAGTYDFGESVVYNNSIWKVVQLTTTTIPSLINKDWQYLYSYDTFNFEGKDSIYYGYIGGFDNLYKRYLLTKKDIVVTEAFTDNYKGEYDVVKISNFWTDASLFIYNNILYLKSTISTDDTVNLPGGFFGLPVYLNNLTYFEPSRQTLSYYPEYDGWASWYEFYPDNYLYNNNILFWSKDTVLFKHNEPNSILIPDNNGPVNVTLEPLFNNPTPVRLLSAQWKTKAVDSLGNEDVLTTFDSIQAYDSYQLSKEHAIINTKNARNLEGYWSCNDFRDDTIDNSVFIINNNLWYRPFNLSNLNLFKHWTKLKKLVDFWFGVRFKYIPYIQGLNIQNDDSGFSSATDYSTYLQATLFTSEVINVGDVLKIVNSNYAIYVKVITSEGSNVFNLKLYSPVKILPFPEFVTIQKITKKPKLHLLDVTKMVIKNIR